MEAAGLTGIQITGVIDFMADGPSASTISSLRHLQAFFPTDQFAAYDSWIERSS